MVGQHRLMRLGREVSLVPFGPFWHVRPFLGRPEKGVSKMVSVGANPAWVVEGSRIDDPYAGTKLQRKPNVRTAFRTKLKIEPASRFVRNVSMLCQGPTRDLDLFLFECRLHRKRRSRPSLTPRAVTDRYADGVAIYYIPHSAADTSTFIPGRHR